MDLQFLGIGVLTWITFLPILGMIAVLAVPKGNDGAMKWISAAATLAQLVLAVMIYFNFDKTLTGINSIEGMQFVEKATWIDVPGVSWTNCIPSIELMSPASHGSAGSMSSISWEWTG